MTILTTCLTKRFVAIEILTLLLLNFSEAVETSASLWFCFLFLFLLPSPSAEFTLNIVFMDAPMKALCTKFTIFKIVSLTF